MCQNFTDLLYHIQALYVNLSDGNLSNKKPPIFNNHRMIFYAPLFMNGAFLVTIIL